MHKFIYFLKLQFPNTRNKIKTVLFVGFFSKNFKSSRFVLKEPKITPGVFAFDLKSQQILRFKNRWAFFIFYFAKLG